MVPSTAADIYRNRRFMNDSVFRSSPSAPLAYSNAMIDPRTPRYSPSIAYDDSLRMTYFDRPYNDPLNPHYQPGSAYDRSAYGYEGIDELVRRTNREVALANAAIARPTRHAQLHPMITPEGRYPADFSVPRRLQDFVYMSEPDLDRILMVYGINTRNRYYHSRRRRDPFDDGDGDEDPFRGSKVDRKRNFIALCDFLGAHTLVEHLMGVHEWY